MSFGLKLEALSRRVPDLLMLGGGIVALVSVLVSLFTPPAQSSLELEQSQTKALVELGKDVQKLQRESAALQRALEAKPPELKERLLAQRLTTLETQVQKINAAILDNPSKALALPLLRRDLESQQAQSAIQIAALKSEIERVYDLSKWLIGAVSLSIIGFVWNQLMERRTDRGG